MAKYGEFTAVNPMKYSRHSELFILEDNNALGCIGSYGKSKLPELINQVTQCMVNKNYRNMHNIKSKCKKELWHSILRASKYKTTIKVNWGE